MIPYPSVFPVADGVRLHYIGTRLFSDNLLSFRILTKMDEKSASAASLISSVLFRGCEKYPDTASVSRRLDMLYDGDIDSGFSGIGDVGSLSFSFSFLDDSFVKDADLTAGCFDLAGELLFSPLTEKGGFLPAYTEREKKNLLDAIEAKKNNKASFAVRSAMRLFLEGSRIWPDEWGSEKSVKKQTPVSLFRQYRSLLRSSPFEIFYIGRRSANSVLARLRPLFDYPRDHRPVLLSPCKMPRRPTRSVEEEGKQDQSHLVLCFRASSPVSTPASRRLAFFSTVFGGSPYGKLFRELREKKSLCYQCDSISFPAIGALLVYCGIDAAKKEEAVSVILSQLDDMKKGRITPKEIGDAKKAYSTAFSALSDSPSALEDWYFSSLLIGSGERPEQTRDRILALTAEDLAAEARSLKLDTIYFLKGKQ